MLLKKLTDKGLISPPDWLPLNTQYLTMMGSVAYGVEGGASDVDIYGITIPTAVNMKVLDKRIQLHQKTFTKIRHTPQYRRVKMTGSYGRLGGRTTIQSSIEFPL